MRTWEPDLFSPPLEADPGSILTCALQSGSNGNAIYVEAAGVRLLFDAGISGRQARLRLAEHQRDIRQVHAVIISHSHTDHCQYAATYQRLFKLPIYATPATQRAISSTGVKPQFQPFQPGDTLHLGAVTVHTLPTPHDAPESVAFILACGKRRIGIFTDLGHAFDGLAPALCDLDLAYLESNYDPRMLEQGNYPAVLKARIRGDGGHLSNDEAAGLLERCGSRRPKQVVLAHLSEQNNHPDLAMEAHRAVVGPDWPLCVASRYGTTALIQA